MVVQFKEATEILKSSWRNVITDYLPIAKDKVDGKDTYVCPYCGHGKGGDGLKENPKSADGNGLKCFGCGFSGDIIDIISQVKGYGFTQALQEGCAAIGITVDWPHDEYGMTVRNYELKRNNARSQREYMEREEARQAERAREAQELLNISPAAAPSPTVSVPTGAVDYTDLYRKAVKNNKGEYLEGRGISKRIQDLFSIGYVPDWRNPNAPHYVPARPYVIFPTSPTTYVARYTGSDPSVDKYKNLHIGKNAPFLGAELALNEDSVIFVVEGETDALSLWELDYAAIALGSTANYKKFLDYAAAHTDKGYIIALDNDGAGQRTIEQIRDGLNGTGIKYLIADVSGKYKDPNERLVKDRDGLQMALHLAKMELVDPIGFRKRKLENNNAAKQLDTFWNEVLKEKLYPPVKTGFPLLDKALDGGLFPEQLVFLGAISSLGKTTFLLQVLDNIAAAGTPVLFFSLEMSRNEIMAKSISRISAIQTERKGITSEIAKSMRGIISGYRYSYYNKDELQVINEASEEYKTTTADNLYIYEGHGDTGVIEIRQTVEEFAALTGKKPVVIIDYLQIMEPFDVRATDKQNVDTAVKLLKQLARDQQIPIVAISSLNRENYSRRISMEAFKESGAVEYSSDLLIGLQLKGTGTREFDVEEAKRANPREVELRILKNRSGIMAKPILYNYYPQFNYWKEIEVIENTDTNDRITSLKTVK